MQGKAKLLGHSLHPMLVTFPIGLLALVPIFDIVQLVTGSVTFGQVSYWMLLCGLIGGLLSAVTGFVDWLSVPRHTRAYRVGLLHLLLNVAVLGIYARETGQGMIFNESDLTPEPPGGKPPSGPAPEENKRPHLKVVK